jgi:hypothetical protein
MMWLFKKKYHACRQNQQGGCTVIGDIITSAVTLASGVLFALIRIGGAGLTFPFPMTLLKASLPYLRSRLILNAHIQNTPRHRYEHQL